MIRHIKAKRDLFKVFRWHEIARSIVFGFIAAGVITLPVVLFIANAVVVWFWRWTLWAGVISVTSAAFAWLWVWLIYALLNQYRSDHGLRLNRRRIVDAIALAVIFFVAALIITLLIIPAYM